MKNFLRTALPFFLGIALACGLLILLQPRPSHALIVTVTQTTLDDFNRGTFYRTGMTRLDDGEVSLLSIGIAGDWITKTNASGLVPRFAHASIIYNGRLYVFGGTSSNNNWLRSIQWADIITTSHDLHDWITSSKSLNSSIYTVTNPPFGAGVSGLSAVELNGYVYLLGGSATTQVKGPPYNVVAFSKIDPKTGELETLTTTTPLPQARAYGQAVALNGRIYYLGGTLYGATSYDTVYYATPLTTTGVITAWFTTTVPLPYAPFGEMAVANKDTNRIYVMSGFIAGGTGQVTNTVYYAEPVTQTGDINAWTLNSQPLRRNFYGGAAVVFGSQIYHTGGAERGLTDASNLAFAGFDEINGGVDSWLQTSDIITRELHTAAVSSDGWIYLVGGSADGNTPITQTLINVGSTTGQSTSAYAPNGTFRSTDFDIVKDFPLKALAWTTYLSDPTVVTLSVRYRTRTSSSNVYSDWSPYYPARPVAGVEKTTISITPSVSARYLQYEAYFGTTDNFTTPILSAVELAYDRPNPPGFVKTANPASGNNVGSGQRITYTLYFTNNTSTPLVNVNIADTIPEGTTYVTDSITASTGITMHVESLPTTLSWDIGTLPLSGTGQVGFVVTVNDCLEEGAAIRNAARLDTSTTYADAFTSHTCGNPPTLVKSHTTSAPTPPIGGEVPVQPGDFITYTLTYNNPITRHAVLNGVIISDVLPPQIIFSAGSPQPDLTYYTTTNQLVRWQVDRVPEGGSGTVTLTVRVNNPAAVPDVSAIDNSANLDASNLNRIARSNIDSTPVRYRFDLQISDGATNVQRAAPGSDYIYTVFLTNVTNMPIAIKNIEVTAYLLPGQPNLTTTHVIDCAAPCAAWNFVELDSFGNLVYTHTIPQLGPNQSTAVTMAMHISDTLSTTAPGVLAVASAAEANASDEAGSETTFANNGNTPTFVTVGGADLKVTQITLPPRVLLNKPAVISVTVFNNGFTQTVGSDGTGWFGVDLYIKPVGDPPPTDPADRYLGLCLTPNPCYSDLAARRYKYYNTFGSSTAPTITLPANQTTVITFTPVITRLSDYWVYAQADTYWNDTSTITATNMFGTPEHGRVREGNELNNIYGPVPLDFSRVYLPLIRKS